MIDYRIRRAEVADAPIVARHRVEMFREMGELPASVVASVESTSREHLIEDLASGAYQGWLAEAGGEVVAGAGALLHKYYPSAANPRGRPTAYILNVYTDPAHRRQGVARRLIAEILAWCRAHDVPRASLHASASGRSVYAQMGFAETNEMRMDVGAARPAAGT